MLKLYYSLNAAAVRFDSKLWMSLARLTTGQNFHFRCTVDIMPIVWHVFSPQTMESSTLRPFEDSTNALTAPEEIATSTRAVRAGLRPTVGSPMALRKRRSCSTLILIVEGACFIMGVLMEGRDCQQSHNQVCPAILVSLNVLNYEVEIGTKNKKSRDAPMWQPSTVIYHAKTQAEDPTPL